LTKMNSFAEEIMKQKYSHIKEDGTKETWEAVAANIFCSRLRGTGSVG